MVEKGTRAKRKLERDKIKLDLLGNVSDKTLDIIKEMVRASNSNPVIGITMSIIFTGIAYKIHLISMVEYIAILTAVGVSDAGAVINDITDLIPSFKKAADSSTPSGTTLVYNDGGKGGSDFEVNRSVK